MTHFKTLIAIAALSTAVAMPVFAQGATHHGKAYRHMNSFNQWNGPVYATPLTNDYWGTSERDRSRVGGEDPDFNPSGN
jgi:hypothetical protein